MHADGGANGHIINDLKLFATYKPNPCAVTQVSGDTANCPGWGLAFMAVPNSSFPIIPLWPCYYMPKNPQNTLSQQALKRYNHFKAVNTEALEWLSFTDKHNNHVKIRTLPEYHSSTLLDYVKVNILKPISLQLQKSSILLPTVNKGIFSKLAHNLSYEALHRRLSHICEKKITTMCKQQTLIGLPKVKPKRHHEACHCTICILTKGKNRNKGKTIDTSDLEPGNMLHIDITFFDITSFRGFNSSLNIIDAKSRKLWGFLSSAKRTPLRIIKYFLHAIQKEGKTVIEIRIDEEGAITRSAEFTSMMIDEFPGIKINTTGGCAS